MPSTVTIKAPASKSVSHRAFICAALAQGTSLVKDALTSDDLIRTRGCLEACGARFVNTTEGWEISGVSGQPQGGGLRQNNGKTLGSAGAPEGAVPADCDVHESGTTCRLITAVLAAGLGRFHIHGAPRMHTRPIGQLTRALAPQGPVFDWQGQPGYPPFIIQTSGLSGGDVTIPLDESSQYLSGLLLAAPMASHPTTLHIGGDKVVSWPYVSLTLMVMADFGVDVAVEALEDGQWRRKIFTQVTQVTPGLIRFAVTPSRYRPRHYTVEGDWSNASYFLAAGALGNKPVHVQGLRRDSLQGDKAILDILASMGAAVHWDETGVTVSGGNLHGVDLDMGSCPDLVPTVCAVAAQAAGPTTIRNVAHLRIKESDRLDACATELRKTGVDAVTFPDGITITPRPIQPGLPVSFCTYGDHRLAMSMSLFELAGVAATLDNPGCVGKSFPGFWDQWRLVR